MARAALARLMPSAVLAVGLALGLSALSTSGRASPQGRVAVRSALCGAGTEAVWQETRWCNGITGDLLFGRERNSAFGFGPFAEISTAGFWDARYGGGLSALAPVTDDFPLVLSFGAFGHETDSVALGGSVFFGARSFNFHGNYNLSAGLVLSAYRDLANDHDSLIGVGLELDGFLFVAPLLFLAEAVR